MTKAIKCPSCGEYYNYNVKRGVLNSFCCGYCGKDFLYTDAVIGKDKKDFRPKHYEKGHDTFAWSEYKFDLETNLNICRFNIHRYNDRDKGQDVEDFEKIIAYAQRALDLIKEDKMEATFDE